MRLAVCLVLTGAAVAQAIVQSDATWLVPSALFLMILGTEPLKPARYRDARRRVSGAATGAAAGAAGTVAVTSWWADGAHAHPHGGDTADASGGDGGGGDGGGCGGCGGCGCG